MSCSVLSHFVSTAGISVHVSFLCLSHDQFQMGQPSTEVVNTTYVFPSRCYSILVDLCTCFLFVTKLYTNGSIQSPAPNHLTCACAAKQTAQHSQNRPSELPNVETPPLKNKQNKTRQESSCETLR